MHTDEKMRAGKILVIDDDLTITDLIQSVLSKEGYFVYTANSGEEGIKLALEKMPHLIFMDIMMPGLDGYETTEKIKNNPQLKEVPVVFLTGRSASEDGGRAFAKGGASFIRKPFKNQQLKDLVRLILSSVNVD